MNKELARDIFGTTVSTDQPDLIAKLLRFLKEWNARNYSPRNTVNAINQYYGDSDEVAEALYTAWNELVRENYLVPDHRSVTGDWFVLSSKAKAASGAPMHSVRTASDDLSPREAGGLDSNPERARTVMVVYGRNLKLKEAMFKFLRGIGLTPVDWEDGVRKSGVAAPYVGQVLDAIFNAAQAVVVILSGDDEARLRDALAHTTDGRESSLLPQARPNVLFEAGMAFGRRPDQTVLVEIGALRPISDLGGRHVVRFDGSREMRRALVNRLETARCSLSFSDEQYLTMDLEYDFSIHFEEPSDSAKSASVPPEHAKPSVRVLVIVERELANNSQKLRLKTRLGETVGPYFSPTEYDTSSVLGSFNVAVLEQFQYSPALDSLDPETRALIADSIGQLSTMNDLEAHFRGVRGSASEARQQALYDLRNSAGPALASVEKALDAVRAVKGVA